ncbi:MAG TPA: triphosphoribosyl-dephospho-CoA synthase [Methanomicrobiales archaeon]|nr:triphosphoribosyl-dephospho-CoA synthase [Methanomicrobiales archaeon]
MTPVERAQMAMMLEVTASPKPGNVDRCHDYDTTRLEHFLASAILARPALEKAASAGACGGAGPGAGAGIGEVFREAVRLTTDHSGGNTHFGAFILLVPLLRGGDIPGAIQVVRETTVEDALEFYRAFSHVKVRMLPGDPLDVADPRALEAIRGRGMTLLDVMDHSREHDMVAREWINGFRLTRRAADELHRTGCGKEGVVGAFLRLLAAETDTFIVKEHGREVADEVRRKAGEVLAGRLDLAGFDAECIARGINPGSTADIIIAGIYIALGEGWEWDCSGKESTK